MDERKEGEKKMKGRRKKEVKRGKIKNK